METSTLARAALLAPLPAVVLEPLTASAYFRTEDGRTSGEPAWIDAWSGPLQDTFTGAFTWTSADTVYLTYGKVFVFAVAAFLCALVALRRTDHNPGGRFRWAWRGVLTAYVLMLLGVLGEYWTPWMDFAFVALALPGLLTLMVCSPFLGARLLRQRVGSRAGGWMLALTPLALIGLTALGGHLGFPVIYLAVAWMLHARAVLRAEQTLEREPVAAPA
jgi:hypothetical protein